MSDQRKFLMIWVLSTAFVFQATALLAESPQGPTAGFGKRRTWSDKSGKFKIEAKLVDAKPDSVKLLKDDDREVTIPLKNLSESDHTFVQSFLEAASAVGGSGSDEPENPFLGGEMKGEKKTESPSETGSKKSAVKPSRSQVDSEDSEESDGASGNIPAAKFVTGKGKPLNISFDLAFWKAAPVTPMKIQPVEEQSIRLPMKKDFFDKVSLHVGGVKRSSVIGVYRPGRGKDEGFARLGSINLQEDKPKAIGQFKDPWKVHAISPDGKQFAAISVSVFDKGNELAMFELGSDGEYGPTMHFTAGGGDWDEALWVGFLGYNRLATISQKNTLTIWDLEAKRATHQGNTGGSQFAAIGGKGELIALPSTKGIAFLSGETGKQVGLISVSSSFVPSIAFSPDGESIAVYTPFNVSIYSLKDGSQTQSIWVKESAQSASIQWLNNYVLLNGKLLIDAVKGMPVWTYETQPAQATTVFGNQLFALFANEKGGSLSVYSLPHLPVEDMVSATTSEMLYCVRPGSKFYITNKISGLDNAAQQESINAIKQELKSLGWDEDQIGDNEVVITLEQGEMQEAEYFSSDGRFGPIGIGFGRPSGPGTKISERSWKYSVVIKNKGREVHQINSFQGLPNGVQLKEGETTIQAVQRLMKPHAGFFKMAKFPKQILDPKYQGGFGKSEITESGIK